MMDRGLTKVAIITLAALLPLPVRGEVELALRFVAGEQYDLHVEQKTISTATVNNRPIKTTIEMTLDSTWEVTSAEGGAAKIKQVVKRVQVKMQLADGAPVEYDSAQTTQPSGAARELAAAVRALVDPEASIELAINQRGEITSAGLSPRLAELWKTGDKPVARESLDALLKQPLVELPQRPVSPKDQWKSSRELATPTGKYKQETTYTYQGRQDREQAPVDTIRYESRLTPIEPARAKVKEQSQSGTVVLADFQKEKWLQSEQQQKLVTETPYRESTITVVVETQVKRTLHRSGSP